MNKFMQILMLSCRSASALIDKKSLFGLNTKEKLQLKMHTRICKACKYYEKQSMWLDSSLSNYLSDDGNRLLGIYKNEELKRRILKAGELL